MAQRIANETPINALECCWLLKREGRGVGSVAKAREPLKGLVVENRGHLNRVALRESGYYYYHHYASGKENSGESTRN